MLYTEGLLIQPVTSFTYHAHFASLNNNSNILIKNLICDIRFFFDNEAHILYFPKIYFVILESQGGHFMT